MTRWIPLALALCASIGTSCSAPDYDRELPAGWAPLLPLPEGAEPPPVAESWDNREEILPALDRSIEWLKRPHAERYFPQAGISLDRTLASCVRLAQLLREMPDARAFQRAFDREFEPFISAGWNGRGGGVQYTAYYTPIFEGSLEPVGAYQYPLYGRPDDLVTDQDGRVLGQRGSEGYPYPSRSSIEKYGLLEGRNLEVVWLRSAMDAYLCHVQGSAVVELTNGDELRLGFAGTNGREYTSLAEQLVNDGELSASQRGVPAIRAWADEHPELVENYLHRNERYVFFTPIVGRPHGSLDFPVTPLVTLATDKSVFPRAAPVFVDSELSTGFGRGTRPFRAVMVDQDTGGGIRTAGRADIYVGVGDEAGEIAGRTASEGQLYYLLIKEDLVSEYAYEGASDWQLR
ncbi:MAG: murein transglycosylase A [Planctomycetota bacterium]|jgi:membrane-bound lytic murein transglycosylase A